MNEGQIILICTVSILVFYFVVTKLKGKISIREILITIVAVLCGIIIYEKFFRRQKKK